jgi:hypothetical protein
MTGRPISPKFERYRRRQRAVARGARRRGDGRSRHHHRGPRAFADPSVAPPVARRVTATSRDRPLTVALPSVVTVEGMSFNSPLFRKGEIPGLILRGMLRSTIDPVVVKWMRLRALSLSFPRVRSRIDLHGMAYVGALDSNGFPQWTRTTAASGGVGARHAKLAEAFAKSFDLLYLDALEKLSNHWHPELWTPGRLDASRFLDGYVVDYVSIDPAARFVYVAVLHSGFGRNALFVRALAGAESKAVTVDFFAHVPVSRVAHE